MKQARRGQPREITIERATALVWQIAFGLLATALVPLAFGLRLHVGQFIIIGAYIIGASFILMLAATMLQAFRWLRKNVRID